MANAYSEFLLNPEPQTATASPDGNVNPYLFSPIDGFNYNQQFANHPYYDLTYQLSRLDALRRVQAEYTPRIYVYRYEFEGNTTDNRPSFRTQMKPGSWIWGYSVYTTRDTEEEEVVSPGEYLQFQVTDECSGEPLFSTMAPGLAGMLEPRAYEMPLAPNQVLMAPAVAVPDPGNVLVQLGTYRPFQNLNTEVSVLALLVAEPTGPYLCEESAKSIQFPQIFNEGRR